MKKRNNNSNNKNDDMSGIGGTSYVHTEDMSVSETNN